MTTPDGLSETAFDGIFQRCASVRLNDYTPYILRIVITEVLLQTDPTLATLVRGLSQFQFHGLLNDLRARRAAGSLCGVG
jgi:hypothetical protein